MDDQIDDYVVQTRRANSAFAANGCGFVRKRRGENGLGRLSTAPSLFHFHVPFLPISVVKSETSPMHRECPRWVESGRSKTRVSTAHQRVALRTVSSHASGLNHLQTTSALASWRSSNSERGAHRAMLRYSSFRHWASGIRRLSASCVDTPKKARSDLRPARGARLSILYGLSIAPSMPITSRLCASRNHSMSGIFFAFVINSVRNVVVQGEERSRTASEGCRC